MKLSLTHLVKLRGDELKTLIALGGWTMENFINWVNRSRNEASLARTKVMQIMESDNYEQLFKRRPHLDDQMKNKKFAAECVVSACDSILNAIGYKREEVVYPLTKTQLDELLNEIEQIPAAE